MSVRALGCAIRHSAKLVKRRELREKWLLSERRGKKEKRDEMKLFFLWKETLTSLLSSCHTINSPVCIYLPRSRVGTAAP